MIAAAIIVLREVFEAALIVGIVLAATRGVPRRGVWVAGGVALGLLGSCIVAGFAERIAGALEGVGQEIFNAGVLLAATAMLVWHNLWMKSHGAQLTREMKSVGADVASGATPLSILLLVISLAVLREGSEVVLFLYGIAVGGAGAGGMFIGSLLGLAAGIAIGAALYRGLLRIPTGKLFSVTSWLLLLLAAGMAAQAAGYLVQAGKLPALGDPVWDTSELLPVHGLVGQVLHALVGYTDRPSGMQLVFFVAVAGTVGGLMTRGRNTAVSGRAPALGALVLVLLVAVTTMPQTARAAHVIYSPVVEQGEIGIEYRGHYDFDGSKQRDGGQQHKLEVEYVPTAYWSTALFGEWEQEPGGSLRGTEIAWENIFQLTQQGKYWVDVGLLAEYAHSLERGGDDALELGLLLEKELSRSVLTVNLLAERALASGAETELEYAMRWRYRLDQRFEPGLEIHGGFGEWENLGSLADHEHSAGPALFGRTRRADGRAAFKYEAALLIGLTHDAPDATLRLQLEYEF